jgi:hypothetical protein
MCFVHVSLLSRCMARCFTSFFWGSSTLSIWLSDRFGCVGWIQHAWICFDFIILHLYLWRHDNSPLMRRIPMLRSANFGYYQAQFWYGVYCSNPIFVTSFI